MRLVLAHVSAMDLPINLCIGACTPLEIWNAGHAPDISPFPCLSMQGVSKMPHIFMS